VDVTVTNTGRSDGDEVVELYLSFPDVKGPPLRALRAYQRVQLNADASQKLHFELRPRGLGRVTEAGDPIIAAGEYTLSVGGGQPHIGTQVVTRTLPMNEQLALPESRTYTSVL
jgi:beta-glucosidase